MKETFLRLSSLDGLIRDKFIASLNLAYTEGINGIVFDKPFDNFDENGLKYTTDHLATLGKGIVMLPLEWMAKYVDEQTYWSTSYGTIRIYDLFSVKANTFDKIYNETNATTIGNLAHIILHSECDITRRAANSTLSEIFTKFSNEVKEYLKDRKPNDLVGEVTVEDALKGCDVFTKKVELLNTDNNESNANT